MGLNFISSDHTTAELVPVQQACTFESLCLTLVRPGACWIVRWWESTGYGGFNAFDTQQDALQHLEECGYRSPGPREEAAS